MDIGSSNQTLQDRREGDSPPRIAVVGAGVSGIVAAHLLQLKYEVTLFEKNDYLGGHTNTFVLHSGPDSGTAIDTGFIVLNDKTYPLFNRFLHQLDIPIEDSDMSFSFHCTSTGQYYSGTSFSGLFARRRNLFKPSYYLLLCSIVRFCRRAMEDLDSGSLEGLSLGDYLSHQRYPRVLSEQYLLPMGAAIWSVPLDEVLSYPAAAFVAFFKNHGLLSFTDRPRWKTLAQRGHSYVKAFAEGFTGEIRRSTGIDSVRRTESGVLLQTEAGDEFSYDHVVLACHADQVVKLLANPSPKEEELLGPWRYQRNHTVLHSDSSFLPPVSRAWASWNLLRDPSDKAGSPVCVTYYMNRLQNLDARNDYFVTLNPTHAIDPSLIHCNVDYEHPVFTRESMDSQEGLRELSGERNTFYCGSYLGYGFHEDAVRSAVEAAHKLGVDL